MECPDMKYTVPNSNSTCTGYWEDRHRVTLLVVRILFILLYSTLILRFIKPMLGYVLEKDKKARAKQKFKRAASLFFFVGMVWNLLFYCTGNLFAFDMLTVPGFISVAGVQLGSVFFFGGVGCVMLMIQQVFLSSCNGNMKSVIITSYRPMLQFTLPYGIAVVIILILILAKVIRSPVVATRAALLAAVIPIVLYAWTVVLYFKPVIKALEESLSRSNGEGGLPQSGEQKTMSPSDKAMQERIIFLKTQRQFALSSCAGSFVIFCVLGGTRLIHSYDGTALLVVQTYNSFVMAVSAVAVVKILISNKKTNQVSATKPTTDGQSSLGNSSFGNSSQGTSTDQ